MWFYVYRKSVCELIPSVILSLFSSSSIDLYSIFKGWMLCVGWYHISCVNEMIRCSKSELILNWSQRISLRSACRQGNFAHSGHGANSGWSYSFRELPLKAFCFYFYFLRFPARYLLPFSLFFLRSRCFRPAGDRKYRASCFSKLKSRFFF